MGIKLFPLPKSKQFNIVTRFYEPSQEGMPESEERIKGERVETEDKQTISSHGAGIRGQFRNSRRRGNNKTLDEVRKQSNIRLLFMLIILTALIYFFLK